MSDFITQILLFLNTVYQFLVDLISKLLEETVLKSNPALSEQFGQGITLLVTLTAIYVILEFFSAAKRVVRTILLIGWLLLILALVMTVVA